MNLVGVSSFLPTLRRMITGPLDISMEESLIDACGQFCRQSEMITASRTLPYWVRGQVIDVSDSFDLQSCQLLRVTNSEGEPYLAGADYHSHTPNSLEAMVDLNGAVIWYAVEPVKDSELVPELLEAHYRDVIAAGAAASLYLQPDRPWTDPRRASEYQARFIEGIRHAGRFRKNNSAPQQVEYQNPAQRKRHFY